MVLLAWLLGIVIAIVAIAIVVLFLNRFYRKSSRDVSLARTGFGGQKIVLSGGCLALPFLHKVDEINMRTNRIEVKRTGEKSLITADRIRIDLELEFYVRVQPTVGGVATAAQSLGARALNPDGIRNLLEGRFIDALQSVVATETMDGLHEKRGEFVRRVADLMRDNLSQNGVLLDSVSLPRLDQAPFASLDENNAFNAVGMRKLAEIIATNKKQRTEIESEADIAVRQTQLDATKRRLNLEQQEEEAHIGQRLEIEKVKAMSDSETAKAREDAMVLTEQARIERERETKAREISKQREIRKLEIEAQLTSELHKVDSSIRLAEKQADEAKAQANAELARTDLVLAQEHVQTQRERAMAERSREIAMKRVQEQGEVAAANAESESAVLLKRVQAESQAVRTKADAERIRLLAESEGKKAVIAAENSRSDSVMGIQLERYRLERMPEILAQMMKPVEKIDSIKIHQLSGFGGAPGSAGASGNDNRSPVNQVMDSITGMALQLPALKSIGESIGYDFTAALPKPKNPPDNESKKDN